MAMEQGLCAQVVMIRRWESDDKKEKEKVKKYDFQGQLSGSRRWFDLDHDWLEEYFRKRKQISVKTVSNKI